MTRLVSEKEISQEEYAKYQTISPTSIAKRMGYSTDLYFGTSNGKERNTIGKYIRLVNHVNELDLISTSKYEELLLEAYRDDLVYDNGGATDID